MKNSKNKHRVGIIVSLGIFLFIISSFSHILNGAAATNADEDDLPYEILGSMTVTSNEMMGSGQMGLGTYTVQPSGAYNRWYEEPSISGGNFEIDRMRMNFEDINQGEQNETSNTFFPINSTGTYNKTTDTTMDGYTVSNDLISHIKVKADYNYSYTENNITSFEIENNPNGDPSGETISGDVESLNQTYDGDTLEIGTKYDYDSEYTIDSINIDDGSYQTGYSDLTKTYDGNSLTYIQINSAEKASDSTKNGGHFYEHSGHFSYWSGSDSNTNADDGSYYEHTGGGSYVISSPDYSVFDGSVYYSVSGLPTDFSNYYSIKVKVVAAFNYDNNGEWKPDSISDNSYMYVDDDTSGWGDHKDSHHGDRGSWSYDTYEYETTNIDGIVSSSGQVFIRLRGYARGEEAVNWLSGAMDCGFRVDYIQVEMYGRDTLDFDVYPEEVFQKAKIVMNFEASEDIRVFTYDPTQTHHDGNGGSVDWDIDNTVEYIRFYDSHKEDFWVRIYEFTEYNRMEFQRLEYTFSTEFGNRDPISNDAGTQDYYVNLRYKSEYGSLFDLYYGDGTSWMILGDLDSTSWSITQFHFTCTYRPQLRIHTKLDSDLYPSDGSIRIELDSLNITSLFHPLSQVKILNFTYYEHGSNEHTENFTLNFQGIYNNTMNNGTSVWSMSSHQFSYYIANGDTEFTIPSQKINVNFTCPFAMEYLNISFSIQTSTANWISSTEVGMEINGDDVLPTTPNEGYLDFSSYPSKLSITAEESNVNFYAEADIDFHFESELTIVSRRVLRDSFTLISDHNITVNKITLDSNLLIESVWIDGQSYSVASNNTVTLGISIEPDETYRLEVYLANDIHKELSYFYDTLGSGVYGVYLSGTTNNYFYDDITADQDFFLQLPKAMYLKDMNMNFSNLRWQPTYSTNYSHDTHDYSYGDSSYGEETVNWRMDNNETSLNGTKVSESGGSGYENIYYEDFDAETLEMLHEFYPDSFNSTYTYSDYLFMQNTFPNEFHEEDWEDWTLDYNYSFTNSTWIHFVYQGYSSTSSPNARADGICWDGTNFYITDNDDDAVYQYSSDFSSITDTFDLTTGNLGGSPMPNGIEYKDGFFYVVDRADASVYRWNSDFSSSTRLDLSSLGGNGLPSGICWDGTNFYIVDVADDAIYKYNSYITSLITSYDLGADLGLGGGICWDGTYFYVSDYQNQVILRYNSDFTGKTELEDSNSMEYYGLEYNSETYYMADIGGEIHEFQYEKYLTSHLNNSGSSTATPSAFTLLNGTEESSGDVGSIDDDYYTFNSSSIQLYNKTIKITEESGSILENYAVKLEIDTQTIISNDQMLDNCSDIRFQYGNGTNIPFYIESGRNTAGTVIWVKVNLTASEDLYIYMTYGNFSRTDQSDPANVFTLFSDLDDFTDFTQSGMTITDGIASGGSNAWLKSDDQFGADTIVESRYKQAGNRKHNFGYGYTIPFQTGDDMLFAHCQNGDLPLYDGYTHWTMTSSFPSDTYSIISLERDVGSATLKLNYDDDSVSGSSGYMVADNWYVGFNVWGSADSDIYIDWIRVRDYVSTEPSVEIFSNFTAVPPTTLYTTFSINCSDLEEYHSLDEFYVDYSLKTDSAQNVSLNIYNQDLGQWEVINSSSATEFFANQFTLNSSYLNSSNCVLFNIIAVNSTQDFQLFIDQFQITYEYTTTEGDVYADISKTIDYSFLNRYDSEASYQQLYNITVEFEYKFTEDTNYTYFGEFNGSYLADYSFFYNELGLEDEEISFINANDGDSDTCVSVIETKDGHRYVLDFYDNNDIGAGAWSNTISDIDVGAIQFWIYFDANTEEKIELIDDGSILSELIFSDDGKVYYDAGSGDVEIASYSANTWYRVMLNFSQTRDCYDIFLNNEKIASEITLKGANSDGVDQFYIVSDTTAEDYHFYIDAIDYSWLNEWHTAEINFEYNSSDLDSFDVNFNITNGKLEITDLNYTITFKCLDGTYYAGDATYSFEDEAGDTGTAITWVDSLDCSSDEVEVVSNKDYHNEIMYFHPDSIHEGASDNFAAQTSGTVEFWLYMTEDDREIEVIFTGEEGGFLDDSILLSINGGVFHGKILYVDYDTMTVHEYSYNLNEWYHIRLDFDCATDEVDIYIDGSEWLTDKPFHSDSDDIQRLTFQSGSDGATEWYVDAIGYSWDAGYNVGDNRALRDYTKLYQYFKLDPVLSLDYLQETRGNWILNFTMNFSASDDYGLFDFYNSVNNSLLLYRIHVQHEDGWNIYNYNSNSSFGTTEIEFNITNFLDGLGKGQFKDFYIEFYLAGNPSNMTLFNLTLYDYDSDFYEVYSLWMDDDLVVSHQNFTVNYRAADRYISHVLVNQTFQGDSHISSHSIYNFTLTNNTLSSFNFFNETSGYYELNLTFYDAYGNWELWTVNYTLIPSISISTSYENPIFINDNNTIFSHIKSEYPIYQIYYDNSTNFVREYNNGSYPLYQYSFTFNVSCNTSQTVNISILVISCYGDSFYLNISNLYIVHKSVLLDIYGLKSRYYQDAIFNTTICLRDMFNQPIPNKTLNYTIYRHDIIETNYTSQSIDATLGTTLSGNYEGMYSSDSDYYIIQSEDSGGIQYIDYRFNLDTDLDLAEDYYIFIDFTLEDADLDEMKVYGGSDLWYSQVMTDGDSFTQSNDKQQFATNKYVRLYFANNAGTQFKIKIDQLRIVHKEQFILTNSSITNNTGIINISYNLNTSWVSGFYHLNVSWAGDAQYTYVWEMNSFEIYPIERSVNSSDISLTVDGNPVLNNTYSYGTVEANSFNFEVGHSGELTFDLLLSNVTLYIDMQYSYQEYIEYEFEFDQFSGPFEYITIQEMNISLVPDNMTYYYYNGVQKSTYIYTKSESTVQPLDPVNKTFNNLDTFEVQIRYLDNEQTREQASPTPRTDSDSVLFRQTFLADKDYKHWFFRSDVTINDINSFEHVRTGTTLTYSDFEIIGNKYRFALDEKTETNDIFDAVLDIDPEWDIDYEVLSNNGTAASIEITYKAALVVENVTLVLDLSNDDVYMMNWSLNGTQSTTTFKLDIPNVNFTTADQTFTISGTSEVPHIGFSSYENEDTFEITMEDYDDSVWYKGYLNIQYYSESFIVDPETSWTLDGIHYSKNDYNMDTSGYFECSGWGSSITTAYLRFKAQPIASVERTQHANYVEYVIDCNLPVEGADFVFYIDNEQRFRITSISVDYLEFTEYYNEDTKSYYKLMRIDLEEGKNRIKIHFEILNLQNAPWLLLAAGGALLGFAGIFIGIRKPEMIDKLKFWKRKNKSVRK